MPATAEAMLLRVQGAALVAAFAQINPSNPQNLDLLQIVVPGDNANVESPTVVINVDYTGAVHNPAVSPTNGTRIGVFQSPLISGGTTAQYFASAFTNPQLQDILQVINIGGNISYYLSYAGVATGS
jgi:hypothetical protein